jgi:tetratricopeptide (TPR) repeat protein
MIKKIIVTLLLLTTHLRADQQADYVALFNHANELLISNNHAAAVDEYNKVIAINPDCSQAHFNKGIALVEQNKFTEAIESFIRATTINPNYTKAFVNLGNAYHKDKQLDKAAESYHKALALDRYYYDALCGLGKVLCEQNKFTEAIAQFEQTAHMRPDDLSNLLDLANTLNMINKTEEALALYKTIVTKSPNNVSILYNIAYTLKKLERFEEAMTYYEKVLSLDPNHEEAHFSLSLAYLIQGDFQKGWPEYEWRWNRPGSNSPRSFSKPLWDGSNLQGKTILIHAEQGLGDTFQFCRYAREIKKQGARIIFLAQDPLLTLLKLCPYVDEVLPFSASGRAFDYHVPLMTLPYLLKTTIDTVPDDVPYLYADPALVTYWAEQLKHDTNFKIGICWQGNANYSTHFLRTAVAAKSIRLEKFAPLALLGGVSIYSLQKTTGEDQLKNLPQGFILKQFDSSLDTQHGRFMDTVAVMKNLDLIITVDTSIAHCAGGLGIPVWVMLPKPPDWRWMLNRDDTPWYPTMRLFRQSNPDSWEDVFENIVQELTPIVRYTQLKRVVA